MILAPYEGPVYVSAFAGACADYLHLLHPDLVPLVSWMGGKRRLARYILALLGLDPGFPIPALLCDASWWGWVWAVVLDPVLGPRVCTILRSWRGEDPRQLWFRLRDMGPVTDEVAHAAAQLLWLQARAASGVPVWWEGAGTWHLFAAGWGYVPGETEFLANTDPDLVSMDGHGRGPYRAWQMTGVTAQARLLAGSEGSEGSEGCRTRAHGKGYHGGPGRLLQHASTQIDEAGQRQATEPKLLASDGRGDPRETGQRTVRQERLVANTRGQQDPGAPYSAAPKSGRLLSIGGGAGEEYEAGSKGRDSRGGGGIVDPGTIADRADRIRARLVKASGGPAAMGKQDGWCAMKGWKVLQPEDIAARADRIRSAAGIVGVAHMDALDFAGEWAPRLGERARVCADGPYAGATGYPASCPRDRYLLVGETWARHRSPIVVHEAVGLVAELGRGWTATCLHPGTERPDGTIRGAEWVTTWGCDVRALLPPLLRGCA